MLVDPDAYAYLPILILMAVGAIVGFGLLMVNAVFGSSPKEDIKVHNDVYECGVPKEGNARQQFSVRYYLVGIVFLLFDVEVVFTFPWVLVYRKMLAQGSFIFFEMILFSVILVATYIYLLARKGLRWD